MVSARRGKSADPIGVLSKTARTFVQDGASTEYATQVLGTTLDHGRLYAKILSTSSRVFYDKEPLPDTSSPYVVYPSTTFENNYQAKVSLDDVPIKIIEQISMKTDDDVEDSTAKEDLNELKDNDIFSRRENNEVRFKPAKVRTDNLPTYTVKQDYVIRGLDVAFEDEQPQTLRPRLPKIFRPQPKVSSKKQDVKPLATVTYHGFADFVTTVGDTVIVFSPSTAPAPIGRPATTIKGDATLRPDDGIAVLKIKPTSIISASEKTETVQIRGRNPSTEVLQKKSEIGEHNSIANLQPSLVSQPEVVDSREIATPVLLVPDEKTRLENPTGLIKVIDSTTAIKGTTTHYMRSIYGTYIGTNYAQIVHTSSNVYFYPEDSTKSYSFPDSEEEHDSTTKNPVTDHVTTLPPETTDNILTTIKEVLTTEATTENELGNDIIPQNQGRSIKGSSLKNQYANLKEENHDNKANKISLATRLLPSTVYTTFTYYTTFFIPDKERTSTSIKSREVVSSEVTFLTELILPTSTEMTSVTPTPTLNNVQISSNTDLIENVNNLEKQEVEEIQLIFKTIFTTFTYLTTFYDDSTTSVSSRKVTATNVITQTIDPINALVDVDRFVNRDASALISPTKVTDASFTDVTSGSIELQVNNKNNYYTSTEDSTESVLTTLSDQLTTMEEQITTETTTEFEKDTEESLILLEPSPITTETTQLMSEQLKTYYTTYTYFTTIIVDDETEIETRTEIFSNIITETIQPSNVLLSINKTNTVSIAKPAPPPEILAYLEALNKQKSAEEALSLAKKIQEQSSGTTEDENETTTDDLSTSTVTDETTILDDGLTTEKIHNDGEVLGSMKTDVIFTSSSGGSTVLDLIDKRNSVPEDQELSETNHHDVEPAPTLLLQTSYTTYTYFTTMYNGDATDVVSRLKTVTNTVTETIRPTAVMQPETKTLQSLTYFTTFTYWTTFIKGDETATTSREETVSNVVTPGVTETSAVQLDVVKTYRPFVVATPVHSISTESKATSENEITTSPNVILKEVPTIKVNELSSTISPEPMTLYTTYTYFTTSYIGNSTILSSRLETITSVSYPDDLVVKATPRAIGGGAPSSQILNIEEKPIEPTKVNDAPKTGLLSTIRSSKVNDGTTTHFATDIYGTYIDGLYAQVVETSTNLELPTPIYSSAPTPVLPTGILSLNKGTIIDADEISTTYYTTKQIGSTIDGLYVKVIESTSSTKVDEEKLSTHSPVHGHRTGLVRLIKGHIEINDTTTYYQSKVIGTSIDGRYAQIIESTSSFLISKPTSILDILPSSTLPPNQVTGIPDITPSPAVIQSSISENHTGDVSNNDSDQEENENEEDDDDQLSKKKSRLTFSSRKRTSSAPPIRPFASRSRPTFNPKRKPQGATTITRSDITPTVTATLAGKGSRFASSRSRATPSLGSATANISSSRRFSGRRSSVPSTSSFSTNYPAGSSRNRGAIRATPSSAYSGSRRGPTSIRGSSARPASRSGSSILSHSSTRYRPGIRSSATILKVSSTVRHDDQEDNANEFTTATLITEETPIIQDELEDATTPPVIQTTESSKRANNPLLKFRRPPAFGSGVRSTTPRATVATTTSRRSNNLSRQTTPNRPVNNRVRPTAPTLTTRSRQNQSNLFPPRSLFGRKPETTESPIENNEDSEEEGENFEDEPVEEISDNDYDGSEQKETANQKSSTINNSKPITQARSNPQISRGRRVRRQTSPTRSLNARFRRPSVQGSNVEEKNDGDVSSSKEDFSKTSNNNARYGHRGRSLSNNSRSNIGGNKEDKSSEEYLDTSSTPTSRSRSKSTSNRSSLRVKPSHVNNSNRQFTLREKETTSLAKPSYKRPTTSSRSTNVRTRNNARVRTGTNRYQDVSNSRRSSSRPSSRNAGRGNNRRVVSSSRGRVPSSHEDYRDFNDFDGTITVTHYVPTEVTIPVVNNGITEKRNIITAQPSTEVLGPDRYSTIANSDGRDIVILASEMTGTNFQGQLEITRFVIHETPTTKVSHMLTSSAGRRFSQPVVIPSTVYSIENVISTIRPSISENAPLANILLSQLLLGQLGQQNPLVPGAPAPVATPSTRYDTRATTYVTTITKQQSTVIPLTFRGKEILTTLIDSSTDVVTATEFITDTVIVTPTVALPAANLNSLLLLLQQPQQPAQQANPLIDPLFAAAPLLTQSNSLPGEVERRNQPVDLDYKPESYEDLSEEDVEKPPKIKVKSYAAKTNEKEASETSVITLYVSGRRPGEFSTVLSTVKVGEETSSTKIKRDTSEVIVTASLLPSLHSASEPTEHYLVGSEEPIDAHSPTQSLESVVGDVGRHISTSIYT